MKATFLLFLGLISGTAMAGNYQLQYSDVFQSCSFIHDDEYSVTSITASIKNMLETKLEGDRACNASFNKIHSEMLNIDKLLSERVNNKSAEDIYNETYSRYLQDLTQESLSLDLNNSVQAQRHQSLQAQIDSIKLSLLNNQFTLQLNKETFKNDKSVNFRSDLYNYAAGMFTALNQAPTECIDKLGGWDQMIPAILRVGGMVGSFVGPSGPIIGAGFTAASQLAVLLQNASLKKSISDIERRRNEAILACTYQSLQTTACELSRADKFVSNQQKISDLIFKRFAEGQNGDYERYYSTLNSLPKIFEILRSIGKMGSAVTLDLNVLGKYVQAIRIDPAGIKDPESMDEVTLRTWLLAMKSRGVEFSEQNMYQGTAYSVEEQFKEAKKNIALALNTINTVTSILKETRSFVDLHSELMKKGMYLAKELKFHRDFLNSFLSKKEFPKQYRGVFASSDKMLQVLIDFIEVSHDDYEDNESFEAAVNEKGRNLFTAMSNGSIAQIDAQTVLMVPEKAFERFTRPFESIEQYFLNQDIVQKENPDHASFSQFVIYKSLQMKVVNDYQFLTGSNKSFRLEEYETTRKSFEKGFRKEIIKMVKNALNAKSEVLTSFEGKTASHMCALFSSFLKENSHDLFKQCWKNHRSLELLNVLEGFHKKKDMPIDYTKPCFYSDYKREENGQRILFERLKDYGNKDL